MKEEIRTLLKYRIERARESLEEAEILLEKRFANTFVNRLYYACFYAVSSLLLTKGLSSAKHSGTRSLFHQNFVKVGIVDTELAQLYDRLFDNRQKADYADLFRFNLDEVRGWYDEVKEFVEIIEGLVNKEMGNDLK